VFNWFVVDSVSKLSGEALGDDGVSSEITRWFYQQYKTELSS